MIAFKDALGRLETEPTPSAALVGAAFDSVLSGTWNPTQVAAFAVALRVRGETAEVILAAAESLRRHMVPLEHDRPSTLDTCGTGGDGLGSLNLSTGAAIIAAAAGVPVAKHGNRAISSKAGSADVVEALGVRLESDPARALRVFEKTGLVFLFAPHHHPAMRHVAPARRELGVRTVFNCIGPLASPARVTHQLLGAYDDGLRPVLAQALGQLGVRRAWVVRGEDGMDEISPYGPTRVSELDAGRVREFVVSPRDFELEPCPPGATAGGDAKENATILRAVLHGADHPAKNAFLINAAAAFVVHSGSSPREAARLAAEVVSDGRARAKLEDWIVTSQSAPEPLSAAAGS